MRVACIGEAMVELSLDADGKHAQVGYAGDTLNTAIYLKRAAPDLDVSYVTRVGRDSFSTGLLEFIAAEAVSTKAIEVSADRTLGLYAISTDAAGERSFSYWRSASAARQMFQTGEGVDLSALGKFDVLFLTAISLAILPDAVRVALMDWLPSYRAAGGRVVFDSNYRPALWEDRETAQTRIAQMWRLTDIAVPSVDDEMSIFGDPDPAAVMERMHGYGLQDGALKCGPDGPRSLGATVDQRYPSAERVVDTTAAGDSFNGGYLAARLSGADPARTLMAGHRLASQVVGVKGAILPI